MINDKKCQDLVKPGFLIKEKWFVLKKIGGGGFGEIYEGVDITAKNNNKNHSLHYCSACYSQESISNSPSYLSDSGIADCLSYSRFSRNSSASTTISKTFYNKDGSEHDSESAKKMFTGFCLACGAEIKTKNTDKVAIKVESTEKQRQVMKMEVAVLKKLIGKPNVCNILGSGKNSFVNYVVMTLQGKNIAELRRSLIKNCFSKQTTFRVVRQCLKGIRSVHEAGYLHRDIKPSNFALHCTIRGYICILDFGLARPYLFNQADGTEVIRPPREIAGFRGTIRYASKNAHNQKDLGRFDDIWSLTYTMLESLDNNLPWRRLKEKDEVGKIKNKINHYELAISLGMPDKMAKAWFDYLTTLTYFSVPDYDYLESILESWLIENNIDEEVPFDWEVEEELVAHQNKARDDAKEVKNSDNEPKVLPRRKQFAFYQNNLSRKSLTRTGKVVSNSHDYTHARQDSLEGGGPGSTIYNLNETKARHPRFSRVRKEDPVTKVIRSRSGQIQIHEANQSNQFSNIINLLNGRDDSSGKSDHSKKLLRANHQGVVKQKPANFEYLPMPRKNLNDHHRFKIGELPKTKGGPLMAKPISNNESPGKVKGTPKHAVTRQNIDRDTSAIIRRVNSDMEIYKKLF